MNYKIRLDVRDLHLRVWELDEELLKKVNEYDSLEEMDSELMYEGEEPLYEDSFITTDCDRFSFVVEDENEEVVYEIDDLDEYLDKDIVVIGISKDSVKSHKNFKTKNDLPFILLSDENLDAISKYDVWHEKKMCGKAYMGVVRTTYIINEEGKIIYANDKVKAVNDALDILRLL